MACKNYSRPQAEKWRMITLLEILSLQDKIMIRPIGREELEIDLLSLAKNQLQTCHFLDPEPHIFWRWIAYYYCLFFFGRRWWSDIQWRESVKYQEKFYKWMIRVTVLRMNWRGSSRKLLRMQTWEKACDIETTYQRWFLIYYSLAKNNP